MTYSSLRLKIIVAAMIVNLCPLLATAAQTSRDADIGSREFLEKARASIVVLTGEDKAGLPIPPGIGFWIGDNLISTDNRVIQSAVRVHVIVPGKESNPMPVGFRDSYRFATILTVAKTGASPLPLGDSDKVALNDKVYLVGGSDSQVAALERSLGKIVIFNENRYFQVAAPISTASRGGPVLNSKGEVIGIAGEGPNGQSVTFVIPATYLTTLLRYRNMGSAGSGGGMGSASAPSNGPGLGAKVPGGAAQPCGQERIALASTPVDTKPVVIKNAQPRYTEEARRNHTQGAVYMRILVGEDGKTKETRVIRGLPDGLIEQAIAAAHEMRFKPATRHGLAVPCWVPILVEFNLR